MAVNYASKYAAKIDERFSREALSAAAINNDYDFVGTKTVNVYSVPTADMAVDDHIDSLYGDRFILNFSSG